MSVLSCLEMLCTIGKVAADAQFNVLGENVCYLLVVFRVEPVGDMPNCHEEVERSVSIMRVCTHTRKIVPRFSNKVLRSS